MRSGFLKQAYNVVRLHIHTHYGCSSDVKGMLWNCSMCVAVNICMRFSAHVGTYPAYSMPT